MSTTKTSSYKGNPLPIIAATFLVIIGIIALIMLIIRWNLKRISKDLDNLSIASNATDYSTSSCSTTQLESSNETKYNRNYNNKDVLQV